MWLLSLEAYLWRTFRSSMVTAWSLANWFLGQGESRRVWRASRQCVTCSIGAVVLGDERDSIQIPANKCDKSEIWQNRNMIKPNYLIPYQTENLFKTSKIFVLFQNCNAKDSNVCCSYTNKVGKLKNLIILVIFLQPILHVEISRQTTYMYEERQVAE